MTTMMNMSKWSNTRDTLEIAHDTLKITAAIQRQILRGLEMTADDYRSLMGLTDDTAKTTADTPKTTADAALSDLYDYYWERL